MSQNYKIAVIGAGPAGLMAAWEVKSKGHSVDLFESHSKPGGCASYFRRQIRNPNDFSCLLSINPADLPEEQFRFDAGATVLWALQEGELLHSKLKQWGLPIPEFIRAVDHKFTLETTGPSPPQDFSLSCTGPQAWMESLAKAFPQDRDFILKHFPGFFRISQDLYKILYSVPAEPFLSPRALVKNLSLFPTLKKIIPAWLSYPKDFAEWIEPLSDSFKSWIKGQILISLQAQPKDIETLYAIMALCFYPMGSGALKGGMMELFSSLLTNFDSNQCKSMLRTKILKIESIGAQHFLLSQDQRYGPYSHVLLSCPRWNSEILLGRKISGTPPWTAVRHQLWSALVAYMVFKNEDSLPQIPFNHMVINKTGRVFYFSVSAPSNNFRTVTASTHENLDRWSYPAYQKKGLFDGKDQYQKQKLQAANEFLKSCSHVFKNAPVFLELGTPQTFKHYTQRLEGFVGGIPLTKEYSYLNSPSQVTGHKNIYQIGDTAFPGQSVVNALVGALEAVRKITNA